MTYLLNAIPGAIIPPEGGMITLTPVRPADVPADVVSAIGHADTARLVSGLLGRTIPENRISVPELRDGDSHYVALYRGPRLPEGCTTLPPGADLSFFRLEYRKPRKPGA